MQYFSIFHVEGWNIYNWRESEASETLIGLNNGNRTYAELSANHFYNSYHWKRTQKIVFKRSGCFQFHVAVVTSTVKESLRSTKNGSLQVLTVL